jgi:tetratricopeptide (TPR) repeat protein
LNLAQVYLARGQFEQAARQVRTALRFRPPVRVVAGYHLERGRSLLRAKKYTAALRACDVALELAPRQPLPYEVRGRAFLALGRYRRAEQAFDQYLRTGGAKTSDLFRGRGRARMKLGKYPEAVADYTRALELAPDGDLYQHRGWAHFFADAWKLARRDFAKAIKLSPAMSDAYTGRGLAQVMLGHYKEAALDAEAALRRKPTAPEMMHNIACIFAQATARAKAEGRRQKAEGRKAVSSAFCLLPSAFWFALADDYRRRALKAIHQTLAMLPAGQRAAFWRDKMLPDPALLPLRNHPAFKQLRVKYGQR